MQENAQPAQEASPILLERSSCLLIDSDRYPLHNQSTTTLRKMVINDGVIDDVIDA
jgi:hypothetical protein